ncbi:hypothetical protein [Escherichia phage vB_EcoM-UFV05]|nr:hypothetical protein [Escherichia phage vB_EcoM-UFV09]UYE93213.1 hypothetical protein [Escherichia phage vB_EcoM-UFV05]UYL84106.1 hypothetical protein [Escherichia phage vB_EcoM-UFV06]UYL84392.1 hypothetical protein [Escherichia phage vB_EcoM-UFV10]UYL84678.1 hypothetical protein [Escherichia phage vB_EcoM-UFV11]
MGTLEVPFFYFKNFSQNCLHPCPSMVLYNYRQYC